MTPSQEEYRTLPLTRGQVTIVDAADYEWLSQWKWTALATKRSLTFYAGRSHRLHGEQVYIRMHRMIMGLEPGDLREVDHINGDSLDNRRSNLRIATRSLNNANRRLQSNNISGYRGVSRIKDGAWRAQISFQGKNKYLGVFGTPEAAHQVYCTARCEMYGNLLRKQEGEPQP